MSLHLSCATLSDDVSSSQHQQSTLINKRRLNTTSASLTPEFNRNIFEEKLYEYRDFRDAKNTKWPRKEERSLKVPLRCK